MDSSCSVPSTPFFSLLPPILLHCLLTGTHPVCQKKKDEHTLDTFHSGSFTETIVSNLYCAFLVLGAIALLAWVTFTFLSKACMIYLHCFQIWSEPGRAEEWIGGVRREVCERRGEGRVRRGVMECSGLERQANWNQGWAVVQGNQDHLALFGKEKEKQKKSNKS